VTIRRRRARTTVLAVLVVLAGCGRSASGSPAEGLSVSVVPPEAAATTGGSAQFEATVTGAASGLSTEVIWSVLEAAGGTVEPSGLYHAPGGAGLFSVVATSVADARASGRATVTVTAVTGPGEPTVDSASRPGPYTVQVYQEGIPLGASYVNPTIYHPADAAPPYPGAIFVPGQCETYQARPTQSQSFTQWGTFLASHGFIVMFVDTGSDGCPAGRSAALTQGMAALIAENTRAGSPLLGKVDTGRMAVMGHSRGGAGALYVANGNVDVRLKAAIGLCPVMDNGFYPADRVPSLILAGQGDPYTSDTQAQYESIPATTSKAWALFAPVPSVPISMHHVADTPLGANVTDPVVARVALSFLEVYLVGDLRYRPFLARDPTMSGFLSNP